NITVNLIQNKTNLGYPKANNQALKIAKGKYVLFLNSDTIIEALNFNTILKYFENNPEVGVLTVKVLLENGSIDPASHRGFPTIWRSFCYFAGLEELFKHVPFFKKVFGGYHLVSLDKDKIHEIDSPAGAFYLTKRSILNKMNGFDESFFMYGEDLDLSFRIKKLGYKIIYYPKFEVIHLKHASGLDTSDVITRKKAKYHFFEAMKIFYRKHHEKNHFFLVNNFIYILIDILRKIYE
ncbi:glycosyltransferase family 2 protein, partial [Candidatus Roizmanbacteria bacterium]|nr:glycosyltransferase family 2 protein [Candidatus Roizmanbacteria bacterium]